MPRRLARRELPPWLKSGRLRPVLGRSPETTPRLRKASIEMRKVIASAK